MISEELWQPGEDTVTRKRETLYLSLEMVERKTLWNTDLSASPLCMVRSWNRSSWKSVLRHMENKEEIQDNHHNLTKDEVLHG